MLHNSQSMISFMSSTNVWDVNQIIPIINCNFVPELIQANAEGWLIAVLGLILDVGLELMFAQHDQLSSCKEH
jgi:hypothetical protein